MVSLNRQSHIVTRYGKSRNITPAWLLSIEPSAPCRESTLFTVDPAGMRHIESEPGTTLLLVSASKNWGTSLRRPERSVTRSVNLCAGEADVSEGSSEHLKKDERTKILVVYKRTWQVGI